MGAASLGAPFLATQSARMSMTVASGSSGCSLAVCAAYAIGLTFGGIDDHVDTAIVSQCLVQLEFELFVLSQL